MTIEPAPSPATSDPDTPAPAAGESRVDISISLAPGARIRVTVESLDLDDTPLHESTILVRPEELQPQAGAAAPRVTLRTTPQGWSAPGQLDWTARLRERLDHVRGWAAGVRISGAVLLMAACLGIYFLTRVIGLTDWPIYFFTDEAIGVVHAADLVANKFAYEGREILPTFFLNGSQYNRGVDVYLQVLPYLLFGRSEAAARMVSVLLTTLAAAWLGLILRDFFKVRVWWAGILFLSITPAWFLHSRTAFETVQMAAFYTGFLYFYLVYRFRDPRGLYAALVLGGLAFYTYSPGQVVIVLTGLLLLASDARYHWQNRRTALRGLGLLALLVIPFVRFQVLHPNGNLDHLRQINSYWVTAQPLAEKLGIYFRQYLYGLSPAYWYSPNEQDLARHLMKGYGNILWFTLPFAVLGLGLAALRVRSSAHRLALIALLAAPSGAALAKIGITRAMVFVIPAALLTTLGADAVLSWLERRRVPGGLLRVVLFCGLAAVNIAMLSDALRNGPTWYTNYGMAGLQYGGRQIFAAVDEIRAAEPDARVVVSTDWANGTDVLARFYQSGPQPYELDTIMGWMNERRELTDQMVFVMLPEELSAARESGRFQDIRIDRELPNPDGQTGFYFVRLRYADDFDEQLAAQVALRRQLQPATLALLGQEVQVRYSTLDMGPIESAFDGDPDTLVRTLEANPLVIELTFPEPVALAGLTASIGGTPSRVAAVVETGSGAGPLRFEQQVGESQVVRAVSLDFGETGPVTRIRIEITNADEGEPAHVHLWEILFTQSGAASQP